METSMIELVKAVSEFGILVVIAAFFLFVTFRMYGKQQKWLEEFIKSSHIPHHPTSEDSKTFDLINSKIRQEILGVLNALKADRAFIYLYHNGGVSTSGLYFQKMSCICEVVGPGVLPVLQQDQNLHRSSFSYISDRLSEQGYVNIPDSADLAGVDNFMYQVLTVTRRSVSIYLRALKDSTGNAVGFIGIDYCSYCDSISEDQIYKLLKNVGLKVSSLVDIRDEVK